MNLVGFCHGDPFGAHSWSGSNRGLFSALRELGVLRDVYDVEIRGLQRYLAAARVYAPDKRAWRHNFLKSPYLFSLRTQAATRRLQQTPLPDAVLQVGAMFDATASHPTLPRFCYLDSNCALSERGGHASFSHHASDDYKRRARERERRVYHTSRGIFVFSDFVRDSLIADFSVPAERIHTIYAGVNLTLPAGTAAPKKDPVVLFIGRDFERKGGPLLLRAFEQVRRRVPNAKLIIAGSSPSVDQPGVELAGFIDKHSADGEARLIDLYRRASVFTMPSHFEPFGIVYAEAMHFGVPCVGVNHCAMPEIISHGVTGLLVPPDNDHALAQALIYVLSNRAEAALMGEAAITKARRLFRWEVVAGKMATIIERSCSVNGATKTSRSEATRLRTVIAPPTTRSP